VSSPVSKAVIQGTNIGL